MGDFCDTNEPRRVSPAAAAVMTPAEKRQTVAFNEYGEKNCGWKP